MREGAVRGSESSEAPSEASKGGPGGAGGLGGGGGVWCGVGGVVVVGVACSSSWLVVGECVVVVVSPGGGR